MSQNKTHALVHNGTPHDEVGYELTDPKVTAGEGRAKCKCGWLSEELPSGGARREAYKRHLSNPEIDTEPSDEPGEDLIGEEPKAEGGTPKPGTKAAKPRSTKKATNPPKADEPKAERGLKATDGPHADVTFDVTPTWLWPGLGVHGAQALAGAVKGVTASHEGNGRKVRFAGASAKRVEALASLIQAAWAAQGAARKAWKKEDPEYRAIVDAKADGWKPVAGALEHKWTREYMDGIAALVAGDTPEDNPGGRSAASVANDLKAEVKAARR